MAATGERPESASAEIAHALAHSILGSTNYQIVLPKPKLELCAPAPAESPRFGGSKPGNGSAELNLPSVLLEDEQAPPS